jgi:hypothetical protein
MRWFVPVGCARRVAVPCVPRSNSSVVPDFGMLQRFQEFSSLLDEPKEQVLWKLM